RRGRFGVECLIEPIFFSDLVRCVFALMVALVKSPTHPSGDVLKLRALRWATFVLFIGKWTNSSTVETDCRYCDRLVERQKRGGERRAAASGWRSAPTLPLPGALAIDIHQRQHCAVDLVVGRAIRTNA